MTTIKGKMADEYKPNRIVQTNKGIAVEIYNQDTQEFDYHTDAEHLAREVVGRLAHGLATGDEKSQIQTRELYHRILAQLNGQRGIFEFATRDYSEQAKLLPDQVTADQVTAFLCRPSYTRTHTDRIPFEDDDPTQMQVIPLARIEEAMAAYEQEYSIERQLDDNFFKRVEAGGLESMTRST